MAAGTILLLIQFSAVALDAPISQSFPYEEEELEIKISDSVSLSGTLTTPVDSDGHLLLILVSPPLHHDRDLTGRKKTDKMFLALAEGFARKGFSVFRFDNRGIGKSTGNNDSATLYTHARDVEGIVRFFKGSRNLRWKRIGLVGISEGGSSSLVVAAHCVDVSFLVLLSTTGLAGWDAFKHQVKRFYEIRGATFGMPELADSIYRANVSLSIQLYALLNQYNDMDSIRRKVKDYIMDKVFSKETVAFQDRNFVNRYNAIVLPWTSPQQIALKKFSPIQYLSKIKCPVLALNGTRDDAVDWSPNLSAIKEALEKSGNRNVLIVPLKNVDHSYHTLTDEKIWARVDSSEKFSQKALDIMVEWVNGI
jgi:pimeloyl-ACP methyl ester carboxylesterase